MSSSVFKNQLTLQSGFNPELFGSIEDLSSNNCNFSSSSSLTLIDECEKQSSDPIKDKKLSKDAAFVSLEDIEDWPLFVWARRSYYHNRPLKMAKNGNSVKDVSLSHFDSAQSDMKAFHVTKINRRIKVTQSRAFSDTAHSLDGMQLPVVIDSNTADFSDHEILVSNVSQSLTKCDKKSGMMTDYIELNDSFDDPINEKIEQEISNELKDINNSKRNNAEVYSHPKKTGRNKMGKSSKARELSVSEDSFSSDTDTRKLKRNKMEKSRKARELSVFEDSVSSDIDTRKTGRNKLEKSKKARESSVSEDSVSSDFPKRKKKRYNDDKTFHRNASHLRNVKKPKYRELSDDEMSEDSDFVSKSSHGKKSTAVPRNRKREKESCRSDEKEVNRGMINESRSRNQQSKKKKNVKWSSSESEDELSLFTSSNDEDLSDLEAQNRLFASRRRKKSKVKLQENKNKVCSGESSRSQVKHFAANVLDDSRMDFEDQSSLFDTHLEQSEEEEELVNNKEACHDSSDSLFSAESDSEMKSKNKKKRRIFFADDDSDNTEDDEKKKGRRSIRKIMKAKQLSQSTKDAELAEKERRVRIAERQQLYNDCLVQEVDSTSPTKNVITKRLILEKDEASGKALIEVAEQLITKLKPHQVEAVQFLWDCCFESLQRFRAEQANPDGGGSGCMLAHCMGLGKTLSTIAFAHTVLRHEKLLGLRTCLVVCPLNTILNWQNEWDIWFDEDSDDRLDVTELSSKKSNEMRADYLSAWQRNGGVMILGYDMFRRLASGKGLSGKSVKLRRIKDIFFKCLINPGPDIIICDEGHVLKSEKSELSKVIRDIRTQRRIVLTGTPLQNNLYEYHTMVSFVKPRLLGSAKEFANRFVNPIRNGEHADSSLADVKIMRLRSHVLYKTLEGCVQRKDYSALTKYLAPKYEYVLFVRLSELQCDLYRTYLSTIRDQVGTSIGQGVKLFADQQTLYRVWTHPYALKLHEELEAVRNERDDWEDFVDDGDSDGDSAKKERGVLCDLDDEVPSKVRLRRSSNSSVAEDDESGESDEDSVDIDKSKNGDGAEVIRTWTTRSRRKKALEFRAEGDDPKDVIDLDAAPFISLETVGRPTRPQWWHSMYKDEFQDDVSMSGKLMMLFNIIRMCSDIGDKLLIFSQSLLSLDIIECFLAKTHEDPDRFGFRSDLGFNSWEVGKDYYRLDGSTMGSTRKMMQDKFNRKSDHRLRLFLISTRAGGLGINLVAANRVIIFDVSWNPTHDLQSIFRTYRFGQTKPVFVYRLIAQGTMEEKIYDRQVAKQSLSKRVIDEQQIERHFTQEEKVQLYTFDPVVWDENAPRETPSVPKDRILAELLLTQSRWLVRYHVHDSLLENISEETLTEEERREAWNSYEEEKRTGLSQAQLEIQKMMLAQRAAAQTQHLMALNAQQEQMRARLAEVNLLQQLAVRYPVEYQTVQRQLLEQHPMLVTAPEQLHQLNLLYLQEYLRQISSQQQQQ